MSRASLSSSLPRSGLPRAGTGLQKSPLLQRDLQGNRSCMLRIGERLMRAGSEGNLVQRPGLDQRPELDQRPGLNLDPNGPLQPEHKAAKASLAELYANPELLLLRKHHSSSSSSSSRHVTAYRSLPNSPSTLPRKLHQTSTTTKGQQRNQGSGLEELREVKRASRLPPCGFVTESDSVENMTEDDMFSVGFTRGSRGRSSLPLHHSTPKRERPLGVVYLQLGEETKQVQVCSDLSNMDAVRALFVRAFPQQLSLRLLQSPHTSICIRDQSSQSYRQLEDIRSISPQCCLKVYVRDPGLELRSGQSNSMEPRISKEILYGGHTSVLKNLQGSMSPPMVRSMPSSPSRGQGSSTLPRQRPQVVGRKLSSNSSAILERRDVMPDEELCPSLALVVHPDALPRAAASLPPSLSSVRGASLCSAPPSLCVELQGPGTGLPRFHASVKPLHSHTEAPQANALHRPKTRQRFGDFPLGPLSPPGSPQRRSTAGGHIIGGVGLVSPLAPELNSHNISVNGVPHEAYRGRSLGSNSSNSSNSSVFVDRPLTLTDEVFRGLGHSGSQSERISVMEEQIASLAGLVHRALSVGAEIPEIQELSSENGPHSLLHHKPVMSHAPSGPAPPRCLPGDALQHKLSLTKQSVCDLRLQLEQLRHQQLCQQAAVHSMLRAMGQELLGFMRQKLLQGQENFYGPRAEVERGRREYVKNQEQILHQLSDLEEFVDRLQRSVHSGPGAVSLGDVELAAVNLRKVGQAMALLKGEFPQLQSRMCSVLRLEVEVVRFLKEEPLKMDSMLSRIRNLTEELSLLHRYNTHLHRSVSESFVQSKDDQGSPKPLPRSSFRTPQDSTDSGGAHTGPASPSVAQKNTTSTKQNMSTSTEETTRIPPDGSVSPDSDQTNADQTRVDQDQTRADQDQTRADQGQTGTDQDRPESSQSHLDWSLQDPVTSRESPNQDPPPASDRDSSPGAEQERSTQAEHTKHKNDSSVFRRPDRPSTQNKSSRTIMTSPPPQRSAVSSSLTNTNSVELKETAGAQVEREKVQVTKPPRQPPEVKPKPQKSAALTGNATFNHCLISTNTTTTATTTTTTVPSDNKEENNNMAEVKVDASLRTTPVERSHAAYGDNHDQPKQTTPQNSTVLKLVSNLQTPVNHISTDQTQNGQNVTCSNTVENNIVTQTDGTSLPVLQKYSTNIVSLEQISQKCNSKDNSATSDQTFTHLIQDTTSQNIILREKGNSSPNKMAEGENVNSNGSNVVFGNQGFEDFWTDFSQEPFIVVWNESIDIEATFNRLSTIVECEEEVAKSRESVLNEDGNHAKNSAPVQFTFQGEVKEDLQVKKSDSKKKFKLKFPKNKLAQISRAIRTGSTRKAKKQDETEGNNHASRNKKMPFSSLRLKKQDNELCKNTLDSKDSLEASVKRLEVSTDSSGVATSPPSTLNLDLERSGRSDRSAPQIQKDSQPPQRKRLKPGKGEQTPLSRPRPSSDPQAPPTDLSLSPQISNRKRPSSHTHTGPVGPVSP